MTKRQLESYNKKIDMLYDKERGLRDIELAKKYHMSRELVRVHLKLARNNFKIIAAVMHRLDMEKRKELNEYK